MKREDFVAGPRIHFGSKMSNEMVDESTLNLTVTLHSTTHSQIHPPDSPSPFPIQREKTIGFKKPTSYTRVMSPDIRFLSHLLRDS